ncbi:exosortase/archaeosortase family protein [Roseisolibacter sp. H3M3-2]|uniref:exosortase/archaeosortase family protein n=1 Tax=Roseisolibacter sp. H3M3-2 TaxID=3031323 RepID=UPI0023DB768B|nr:exosortase/archaeosortase family protein [Roseisolibacter sp. H3M3-2]MDF1502503.1 exosortase/archaeosortase family protein [Roseisolibacter sp. H3M3-2]
MTTQVRAETPRAAFLAGGLPSLPTILTAALFAVLYARPAMLLARDWWSNPEAGHGLLLAPIALWFAWKAGIDPEARPNRWLGVALLLGGVGFRWVSELAAELFVMRGSMLMAAAGVVAWHWGFRQLMRWWLPFVLLALSIPLPDLILSRIALPLQFTASKIGAALLDWRDIPVLLTGNVIRIPGHELFVAEACSGLRSLTALLSLGVLLGAISLDKPISRVLLLAMAIPVAIILNGFRVFLTGFLVYFVDPKLGEGFMHLTEGWLIFVIAFLMLGGVAWSLLAAERWLQARRNGPTDTDAPEVAHA